MKTTQGFTLMELLLSLTLIMSISLLLLEQQLKARQALKLCLIRSMAERLEDNNSEYLLAHQPLIKVQKPFAWRLSPIPHGNLLEITWGLGLVNTACCKLQRELVTE